MSGIRSARWHRWRSLAAAALRQRRQRRGRWRRRRRRVRARQPRTTNRLSKRTFAPLEWGPDPLLPVVVLRSCRPYNYGLHYHVLMQRVQFTYRPIGASMGRGPAGRPRRAGRPRINFVLPGGRGMPRPGCRGGPGGRGGRQPDGFRSACPAGRQCPDRHHAAER